MRTKPNHRPLWESMLIKIGYKFRRYPWLFDVMRSVHVPKQQIYKHLLFKGPFTVRFKSEAAFRMIHYGRAEDSQIENDLFWKGIGNGWEGTSLLLWACLARDSKCIYDIGANTGVYALFGKWANPAATVVAFEPSKRAYERLGENINLNQFKVIPEMIAVSNASGEAILYDNGGNHIDLASLEPRSGSGCSTYSVPTVRLDEYCRRSCACAPDLLKIDVEGHEPQVLEGLGTLLAPLKPTILIEVLDERTALGVMKIIKNLDYQIFAVRESIGLERVTEFKRIERRDKNYLLCQAEFAKHTRLGERLSHTQLLSDLGKTRK